MSKITIKAFSVKSPTPKIYTGDDLLSEKAPVGFYKNVDKTYNGIILVSKYGYCTYFDVNSGVVYSFNGSVWGNNEFVLIPDMKKIEVSIG